MGKLLQRIAATYEGALSPGEHFVAAGRGRTVPGTETAAQFPPLTIWAVTAHRLFVWTAEGRGNLQPGQVLSTMILGTTVNRATVAPYEPREVLLSVFAGEHAAMVLMDPEDARAIAQVIGEAVAAMPAVDLDAAAPTQQFDVEPVDETSGDERIATIRAALADGDWEGAADVFASATSAADRELFATHLDGDELLPALDAWAEARQNDPDAYLARGSNIALGAARRLRAARPDDPVAREAFHAELRDAERDLLWAVELNLDDAVPWTTLLRTGRGLEIPKEELCMRYDESARRAPELAGAHLETLEALGPRGVGSTDEMFAFARTMARSAPEGSLVHGLVPMAHLLHSLDVDDSDPRRRYFSGDPAREIDFFAKMSVDNEAYEGGPASVEVVNIFAAAFAKCGDLPRARSLLERVGSSRSKRPWTELRDGDVLFHQILTTSD